jgi:hypothetical protein
VLVDLEEQMVVLLDHPAQPVHKVFKDLGACKEYQV